MKAKRIYFSPTQGGFGALSRERETHQVLARGVSHTFLTLFKAKLYI
jgi:hypothetical protein